ncbi:MAG: hypothetical protein IIW75_08625 [Bacteroidaceae bacterium]|nr:hypothetical protein [Bacteroidaceae bacterium]
MVNEVKTKAPSSPLPYYAYADLNMTWNTSATQMYKTVTFSASIDWGAMFIKALYQNYNTSAPCEVNVRPVDDTHCYIHIRNQKKVATGGLLRVMALVDRPVTMTIS